MSLPYLVRRLDVRQTLWDSACAVADHVDWSITSHIVASPELELRMNGGVAPNVAWHYTRILIGDGLPAGARILDFGCGYGRMAMELARQLGSAPDYIGLDPHAECIAWAQQHITTRHANFSFDRVDLHSGTYNPSGALRGADFRFPFDDGSLDLVCMLSVLTHVDLPTAEHYIREAGRVLKADTGRLVATAFLLDDEVDALIAGGHATYRFPWPFGPSRVEHPDRPEEAVAHPRAALLDMLERSGFTQRRVVNGHWSGREAVTPTDFQDLLLAGRTVSAGHTTELQRQPPAIDDRRFPAAVFDRLAAGGFADRQTLLDFVTWSASITLNALWWQRAGLTLALASGKDVPPTPLDLRLTQVRTLGLELAPQGSDDVAALGHYRPVDEPALLALVVATGRASSRYDILAAMLEAADNGLVVREAMRAGRGFVLRAPGAAPRAIDLSTAMSR